jgi:hypothetical protein
MCLDVAHPADMKGATPTVSLQWVIYHALVQGAPHGLSLTFKPPQRDDQLPLTHLTYGIAEVNSSLVCRIGVKGDQLPPTENALFYSLLSQCFCMHQETPNSIAFCPTTLGLMYLKFQFFLQTVYEWWEVSEWQYRKPPVITRGLRRVNENSPSMVRDTFYS